MITKPTVLVLGAGASAPYGYPTGQGLQNNITEALADEKNHTTQMLSRCGFNFKFITEFKNTLLHSSSPSIDAFLEYRDDYMEIGKLSITLELVKYERPDILYTKNDWYTYLFNKLTTTFDEFDKNKLSIITFNYDRSLDYFIHNSLKNRYKKDDAEILEKLKNIPIIHVHGQIGHLGWQNITPSREYYHSIDDVNLLKESASGIRIIHESSSYNKETLKDINKLLNNAKNIYFLGFGFHKLNLDRLFGSNFIYGNQTILGTSYQMTDRERQDIATLCSHKIDLEFSSARFLEIKDFLREHVSFT